LQRGCGHSWGRENTDLGRTEGQAKIEENSMAQTMLVQNVEVDKIGDIGETADHLETVLTLKTSS